MWATPVPVLRDSTVPRSKPRQLNLAWLLKIGRLFGTNPFTIVENNLDAKNGWKMYSLLVVVLFLILSGYVTMRPYELTKGFVAPELLHFALAISLVVEGFAFPIVVLIHNQRFAQVMITIHTAYISDDNRRAVELRCRLFCYFTAFAVAVFTAKMIYSNYTKEGLLFLFMGNLGWMWDTMQIALSFLGGTQFCSSVLLLKAQITQLNADILDIQNNRRCGDFLKMYEHIFRAAVSLNEIYHVPLLALFLASFLNQILGFNMLIIRQSFWILRLFIASMSMLKLWALISVCESAHRSVSDRKTRF